LFVARLQAGQLSLERDDVDLGEVVRDAVAAIEAHRAGKEIRLTTALAPVPRVHADRGRLLQLLDNLLSNAVKFTPAGGEVHVTLANTGGRVRLEVSDSGIGISPEDQRRLFERFFRGSAAIERQLPGTGLGLYISRAIAEAHDGTLEVSSELGRGSTFCVQLPLARAAVAA